MRERSLWVPAAILAPIAAGVLWLAIQRLEGSPPWLLIAAFGTMAVVVDDWPKWVGHKLAWSHSGPLVVAATVLVPTASAPLVGALVIAPTALFSVERRCFRADRLWLNICHLVLEGFTLGLVVGSLRGPQPGPGLRLAATVVIAQAAAHLVSLVVVGAASLYRFGRPALRDLVQIARLMPASELPAAAAAGLIAGAAAVAGSGWVLAVAAMTTSLSTLPLTRSRLAWHRTTLISSVTNALDEKGFVGAPFERIERLALCAGRRLQMTDDELQQVRYAALSYSMADVFSNELARPLDFPSGLNARATRFSRVLFYGLALSDVATGRVEEVADAAARLDGLCFPEDEESPVTVEEAVAELRSYDVDPLVLEAVAQGASDAESYLEWREPLVRGLLYPSMRTASSGRILSRATKFFRRVWVTVIG